MSVGHYLELWALINSDGVAQELPALDPLLTESGSTQAESGSDWGAGMA